VRDPLRALKEFRRVLQPGGVAGIRDPDYGRWFFEPATPLLETFRELSLRVAEANGNSPTYSRHLRRLLLDVGFVRTALHTSTASRGTAEEVRRASIFDMDRLQAANFRDTALREGKADDATLSAIEAELRHWGQRPDASAVVLWHEALGWVSDN
jgi:SAM-dependent methyltransferase